MRGLRSVAGCSAVVLGFRDPAHRASMTARSGKVYPKMKDATRIVGVLALVVLTPWLAVDAAAQGSAPDYQFFVNVEGGYQSGSATILDSATFSQYGEEGSTEVKATDHQQGGRDESSSDARGQDRRQQGGCTTSNRDDPSS